LPFAVLGGPVISAIYKFLLQIDTMPSIILLILLQCGDMHEKLLLIVPETAKIEEFGIGSIIVSLAATLGYNFLVMKTSCHFARQHQNLYHQEIGKIGG
jgi:hypothetical protein